MDKRQISSVIIVVLAIMFIGASVASSKIKTLKKIKTGSITNPYIGNGAVNSAKIEDGSVSSSDIADNSITTGKIADGEVNTDDLANNSVTTGKISDGTVAASDLADSAVTSAKISDGTIIGSDLSSSISISTTDAVSADYTNVNYVKFRKKTSAPVTCNSSNDGVVALTHFYALCACNGGNGTWYHTHDYSACQW